MSSLPSYLRLLERGELAGRADAAWVHLEKCDVCPRCCKINRLAGKVGNCRVGERARVSGFAPHFGEEKPLSGWRGSGTIFFSRCNLSCVFCQNYDISQFDAGVECTPDQVARMMLQLQQQGCHNINLVTPSHIIPQILSAVLVAAREGLRIPLVYNSGGYDSVEMLKLLDGVIDIYMPDMKFGEDASGKNLTGVPYYTRVNQAAVMEMHRQVGDLVLDERGVAVRGLLIRHLVLPNGMAHSREVLEFISTHISKNTYLNIMDQYHPAYKARAISGLKQPLTVDEYQTVLALAGKMKLFRFAGRN